MLPFQPHLVVAGLAGLVVGGGLLLRGLDAYRRAAIVSSIATSHTDGLAAGEVRLTGRVEPLATTLISALQSEACVWYHSRIIERGEHDAVLLDEQRSVEFLVRDDGGAIRVIPRGALVQLAASLDVSTDLLGGEPPELNRRVGPASAAVAEYDHDAAVADLLTVRPPTHETPSAGGSLLPTGLRAGTTGRRHYTESRLEPGMLLTLVGFARPYAEVGGAGGVGGPVGGAIDEAIFDDPAIAAELADAREHGALARTAREAWGNAAIPGFGIGRPIEKPVLDNGASAPGTPDPGVAARAKEVFDIPPETLVVTSAEDRPLTIYAGTPADAEAIDRGAFYRGLAGGGLVAASAMLLALTVRGGL